MKVADILRVKGSTLYTVQPDEPLAKAAQIMAEKDIGSLVVMEHGDLVGMLTFREVIVSIVGNGGEVGSMLVRKAMDQRDRAGRSAPHDARPPRPLHARDEPENADGRDQSVRRRQSGSGQPEF